MLKLHNEQPPEEDIDVAERIIRARFGMSKAEFAAANSEAWTLQDALREVIDEMEHPEPWLELGLAPLDRLLDGGLRPGEMMLLAARPGIGKSSLALQFILSALQQTSVALWSLEMRPKQWARRAACSLAGVSLRRLRRGECQDDELIRIQHAVGSVYKAPLYFGASDLGCDDLEAECSAQVELRGCKLLVFDYLQLIKPSANAFNRENEVAKISNTLKQIANRHSVSVLALCQLNRNAEGKVPTLADLRDSGALEQDADEVFFLHREQDEETHIPKANGLGILAKNRDGETGGFGLMFDAERFSFNAMTREEPSIPSRYPLGEYERKNGAYKTR